MDKQNIAFAISMTGASHLPKGVPCQDYSVCWQSEDGNSQIAVVCDGHGSSTYVRSDIGSRLAGEVAKTTLIRFIQNVPPTLFLHQSGAVTSRPTSEEAFWGMAPTKPVHVMTEIEQMNYRQNQLFFQQVQNIREQDNVLMALFTDIYNQWIEAITKDCQERPFSEGEQKALGNHKLVKAYGTTLLAFVKTPYYWLSFQIGDGRIVAATKGLDWDQPVPWDCNCFQNFTTSLCNSNPVIAFRYAFDGTGKFPAAIICSSDGMEDSYGDYDIAPQYLHNFYTGILNTFLTEGRDKTVEKLREFLPKLSAAGSKDDMSMAGIIDLNAIIDGLKMSEIRSKRDELNAQHLERISERKKIEESLNSIQDEINYLGEKLEGCEVKKRNILDEIEDFMKRITNLHSEETIQNDNIRQVKEMIKSKSAQLSDLRDHLNVIIEQNNKADDEARARKLELKQLYDDIEAHIAELDDADLKQWEAMVATLATIEKPSVGENNNENLQLNKPER